MSDQNQPLPDGQIADKKPNPEQRAILPDTAERDLFLRYAPAGSIPYIQLARLDRPIGWWLLLLPCWWSAALAGIAQGQGPNLWHVTLFYIGAIAMRGAVAARLNVPEDHVVLRRWTQLGTFERDVVCSVLW